MYCNVYWCLLPIRKYCAILSAPLFVHVKNNIDQIFRNDKFKFDDIYIAKDFRTTCLFIHFTYLGWSTISKGCTKLMTPSWNATGQEVRNCSAHTRTRTTRFVARWFNVRTIKIMIFLPSRKLRNPSRSRASKYEYAEMFLNLRRFVPTCVIPIKMIGYARVHQQHRIFVNLYQSMCVNFM